MNALSPKLSSQLAAEAYTVTDQFKLDAFLQRPEFLNSVGEAQSVRATVGGHYIKSRVGFGVCARGARQFNNDIFLVFRGSSTGHCGLDWLSNVRVGIDSSITGLPVHTGFNEIFYSLHAELEFFIRQHRDASTVHCIGHSSGGAVATLVADWVQHFFGKKTIVYTFGAPKVGFESFAKSVTARLGGENIHRVYHSADPVPMLPLYPFLHTPSSTNGYQLAHQGAAVNHNSHLMLNYRKSLCRFERWQEVICPLNICGDSEAIENWLCSDCVVSPYDPQTWSRISASLALVLKKTVRMSASLLQLPVIVGLTLADRIAWLLSEGMKKAIDIGVLIFYLMRKIMHAFGMSPMASQEELNYELMRNTLMRVMNKIGAEAKQAIACMEHS